jgi:hypothetical protein
VKDTVLSWLVAGFVEEVGRDDGRLVHLLWMKLMRLMLFGVGVLALWRFGVDGSRNFLWAFEVDAKVSWQKGLEKLYASRVFEHSRLGKYTKILCSLLVVA